jgi:hypothetical protein
MITAIIIAALAIAVAAALSVPPVDRRQQRLQDRLKFEVEHEQ